MIRCDHCGWSNNPDGTKKCQKCNQELVFLPPVSVGGGRLELDKITESECPKCGYPLSSKSSFCPSCGTSLSAAPSPEADSSMKKTVRDLPSEMKSEGKGVSANMKQTMRDVPSFADCEALEATSAAVPALVVNPDSASFRLRPVDLNIPETFAFGADADAAFEFVDGQWFITDRSGTGSTYICASRRIALQKGDVVIIGGRRYKFE